MQIVKLILLIDNEFFLKIMKTLLTLFVLFFSSSVVAEYQVKGDEKCSFILSLDRESHPKIRQKVASWMQGYFTGRNYVNDIQMGKNYDYDTLYFLVLKYCRDNPSDFLSHAAEEIYYYSKKH